MTVKLMFELPDQIETERLYLRPFRPGDGRWYYEVGQRNHDHLMRYEADNVVMEIKSVEEAETAVCDLAADWKGRKYYFMCGFERSSGEFAVQIYIGPVKRGLPEFEIGYFVDKDHEGRGYVTEAAKAAIRFCFVHLNAHRVSLRCDETNERSFRVAERCGMVREGYFRETRKNPDGSYTGTLHYGMLRSEWECLGPQD